MILAKLHLEKLESHQLLDLANFIVEENFNHHSKEGMPEDYRKDVHSIYEEEKNFFENSRIFAAKDSSDSMVGAIRVLKWNYTDVLPLQKIFGINPLLALSKPDVNNIYHIGRFAVKKEACDLNLFKRLLICVAELICGHKGNVAFAECDSKLLRILNLLGVKTMVIGESVNYLGSETIPIAMTYDGVIGFYNKNKSLISKEAKVSEKESNTVSSVEVFTPKQNNYSFV